MQEAAILGLRRRRHAYFAFELEVLALRLDLCQYGRCLPSVASLCPRLSGPAAHSETALPIDWH